MHDPHTQIAFVDFIEFVLRVTANTEDTEVMYSILSHLGGLMT